MEIAYAVIGKTKDGKRITGNVVFNSKINVSDQQASYIIIAYQFFCNGEVYSNAGPEAGSIRFSRGSTAGTIVTTGADWDMGIWHNSGTGVWFKHADGIVYDPPHGFPQLDDYRHLAPRIKLNCDLVTGGTFHPFGNMQLIWNPQFLQ